MARRHLHLLPVHLKRIMAATRLLTETTQRRKASMVRIKEVDIRR
jgi:hypothetical protein